jgi:hypothetical protein
MEEDKLTEFQRAEYYKARMKSRAAYWITFSILMFIAGFMLARAIYIYLYEYHKAG